MSDRRQGAPIFVPLATEPFNRFKIGEKTVEVRELASPVARQVLKDTTPGRPVTLSRGYGKRDRLARRLGIVWTAHGLRDLPADVLRRAALTNPSKRAWVDPEADLVAFEALP